MSTPTPDDSSVLFDAAYAESLRKLLDLADHVPLKTGILHHAFFTYTALWRHNGVDAHDPVTPLQWQSYYNALQSSARPGSRAAESLPPLDGITDKAKSYQDNGIIPLTVAHIHFEQPKASLALDEMMQAAREGRAIDIPTVPETQLEERVAFLASVLLPLHFNVYSVLPPVHNGLTVRYVLDREFYFTNAAERPGALDIDFGDNTGVRTVRFGETVVITYAHEGAQHLQVWASLSGQRLLAEFTVQVRDTSAIRPPDDTWTLMADIPYDGQEATGQAYILYGTEDGARHGSLVNPIIIADGFPGHPYEEIYDQLNKQGFLSSVLGRGYDIVLLTYTNGSDLIQRNAFLAVKCIQTVIHNRTGDQRLIVGGASMGGIVTRYALAYMEKNGLDHQTALYLSFDSPHRGAYVPVSVQHLVRVFAEYYGTAEAKHNWNLLKSPASLQLLVYSVLRREGHASYMPFYQELEALGLPQVPRKVAVSNGAGDGKPVIPDHTKTLTWYQRASVDVRAYALGVVTPDRIAYASWFGQSQGFPYDMPNAINPTAVNYDGAPGGQYAAYRDLGQSLMADKPSCVGADPEVPYPNNCFIPTVSAVNIPHGMEHPFQIVPGTGANTGFDKYFLSSTNTPHVDITPEIDAFLLDQLPRPFQAPLLQLALTGVDNHPYVFGSWDGTHWLHRPPGPTLPDFTLPVASSLAAGGNTLYLGLLVTSPSIRIFFFFSTDSIHWYPAWTNWIAPGFDVKVSPALAAVGNRLYVVFLGTNQAMYITSVRREPSGAFPILPDFKLQVAPSLAAVGDRLYLALVGLDQHVYISTSTSTNSIHWSNPAGHPILPDFNTIVAPSLAAVGDRLYLALVGLDQHVYISTSTDGMHWSDPAGHPILPDFKLQVAPSLAAVGVRLYLALTGLDQHVYISTSTDSMHWSDPAGHPILPDFNTIVSPSLVGFLPA